VPSSKDDRDRHLRRHDATGRTVTVEAEYSMMVLTYLRRVGEEPIVTRATAPSVYYRQRSHPRDSATPASHEGKATSANERRYEGERPWP
jgi:hypothetical protein